jgi:DNA-binding NarL/FixJ family response regulator
MQSDNRFVGAVKGMAAPGGDHANRAGSSRAEDLRVTFSAWMRCREESAEVLMAAQPIIRATVASTLGNRVDLRDEAESMALEYIWKHLKDCRSDIVPWVRAVAKGRAFMALRIAGRSKEIGVGDYRDIETAPGADLSRSHVIDLGSLTPMQRSIATLLMDGASHREVRDSLRISENQFKIEIGAIREIVKHQ